MPLQSLYYTTLNTPIQSLFIVSSEKGLIKIIFYNKSKSTPIPNLQKEYVESSLIANQTKNQIALEQLSEYFKGIRKKFSVPLDIQGTSFQKLIWRTITQIPYGQTCSYGEIAKRIGKPKAARAVGMANHNNPIPIIIPCHRIIGSDGSLTGYAAGMSIKEKLLDFEKNHMNH